MEGKPCSEKYDRIVHLPESITKFRRDHFKDHTIANICRMCKSGQSSYTSLSSEQYLVCKYSGGALVAGRPLNSVVILMAGASGSGKSSTINSLFDDKQLCSTSASRSDTKTVIRVEKQLRVAAENPAVFGNLTFIDVPGTFDTDSNNEAVNMASIRKFKKTSRELEDRRQLLAVLPNSYKVYPNIVLFVVSATDKRMDGPNSFLVKSLKAFQKTADYIDKARNNVIVVLTNAMMMGRKLERFSAKLQEITQVIHKQFRLILGINDVNVVPVENEPEDHELDKIGDFYKLPNDQLSHLNLFEAMLHVVDKNNDLLGRLFICWYFGSNCPEKQEKAQLVQAVGDLDDVEIAMAAEDLNELQILSPAENDIVMTPCYNFQNLGRGFCPVTEEVKPATPLACWGDGSKIVSIENTKFSIPNFIHAYINSSNSIHRLSFMEKEEYQQHMKQIYGIDGGFKLVVAASSQGRWVNGGSGSDDYSLVSIVQEMKLATFQIDNPKGKQLDAGFMEELRSLPEEYNYGTTGQFAAFFSRWGTHMIVEVAVGGSVQLNCTIKQSSLTREQLQNVEAQVSGIFSTIFTAKADGNYNNQMRRLKEIGVCNDFLRIYGGTPPPLVTLDTVTPDALKEWSKSVCEAPAELSCSIKLYPYYNLLDFGSRYTSLHDATKDYLSNRINFCLERLMTMRNDIAQTEISRVIEGGPSDSSARASCFPKGAMVTMENGRSVKIEELACEQSQLQTLKLGWGFKKRNTAFCTYLHNAANLRVQYLDLEFDNGQRLTASPGHIIFGVGDNKGQAVQGKQVKQFKVGDRAIYYNNSADTVETPKIVRILEKTGMGAYAPLTSTGTLIVNGFLVSSYANTGCFSVADAAMLPLKLWCKMKRKSGGKKSVAPSSSNDRPGVQKSLPDEIHLYAKLLISLRNAGKIFN